MLENGPSGVILAGVWPSWYVFLASQSERDFGIVNKCCRDEKAEVKMFTWRNQQ